ncbi:hypothetical protein DFJ73DRAFT_818378 [Zopfochytrium polystomum]|nr:hypothetical protein DFJ73DRAFT_818378 [Zopfochytrium polystomum]
MSRSAPVAASPISAAFAAAAAAFVATLFPAAANADFVSPDWTALGFPSGNPVPISGSLAGDLFKVPIPPVADSWTNAIVALAPSPIPNLPVNGELGAPGWAYNAQKDLTNCPANTWAITYDDGPKDLTQQYLSLLANNSAKGTFFVLGSNVVNKAQWANNLQLMYNAGHQIGLHTWTHRRLTNETTEQIIAEFIWNALAVKQVIGKVPRYMRPPYGDTDDRLRAILDAFGFKQVIWNVITNDTAIQTGDTGSWKISDAVKLINNTIKYGNQATGLVFLPSTGGYISLEHELTNEEFSVATQVMGLVKNNSYQFATVAKCIAGSDTDADRYMSDSDPFVKFLNTITFPIDQNLFKKSSNTSSTSAKSAALAHAGSSGFISAFAVTVCFAFLGSLAVVNLL